MTTGSAAMDRFVILADESAEWKIAGLRQLDRLVLALNEFAGSIGSAVTLQVVIFWRPNIPSGARWLPNDPRTKRLRMTEALSSLQPGARILSTRLFVDRNGLAQSVEATPTMKLEEPMVDMENSWNRLREQFDASCREALRAGGGRGAKYLDDPSDAPACERKLLRQAGKSQDGVVSRFINRPISRIISRVLLKFPITPNAWTMLILILPLVACVFLVRGDYAGFVLGTALFQIYNIFDGCDGEIARAKYLDCEKGRRLDASCDLVANLVFVLCVGVGLVRQPSVSASIGVVYLLESLITVLLMAVRLSRYVMELLARDTTRIVSHRHEEILIEAGERVFGRALTAFLFQITKRDVAFFAFLLLAIASAPSWILHFFFIVSVITISLALKDIRSSSSPRA